MDPAKILDLKISKTNLRHRVYKKDDDLAKIARDLTGEAVYTLVNLLDSEDEKMQLSAAKEILDRGWGKPKEIVVSEESPSSIEELKERIAYLDNKIDEFSL